jgi:2-amino-4-hydroxy-6-hydroxymethyldihydropteridine diphosphokinase
MNQTIAISLGSNLGDRRAHLRGALRALESNPHIQLIRVSDLYETEPVGGPPHQSNYLNAAAILMTDLAPAKLLAVLQELEAASGRIRDIHWGARTLDVDLLLHRDTICDTPDLRLPHPGLPIRRFVLAPLAEIAPDLIEPGTGLTIQALLDRLDQLPRRIGFQGWEGACLAELVKAVPTPWMSVNLDQLASPPRPELLVIFRPERAEHHANRSAAIPILPLPADMARAQDMLRAACHSVTGRVLRLAPSPH